MRDTFKRVNFTATANSRMCIDHHHHHSNVYCVKTNTLVFSFNAFVHKRVCVVCLLFFNIGIAISLLFHSHKIVTIHLTPFKWWFVFNKSYYVTSNSWPRTNTNSCMCGDVAVVFFKNKFNWFHLLSNSWPDGSEYNGEWDDGMRSGRGDMSWPSVRFYLQILKCIIFCFFAFERFVYVQWC